MNGFVAVMFLNVEIHEQKHDHNAAIEEYESDGSASAHRNASSNKALHQYLFYI